MVVGAAELTFEGGAVGAAGAAGAADVVSGAQMPQARPPRSLTAIPSLRPRRCSLRPCERMTFGDQRSCGPYCHTSAPSVSTTCRTVRQPTSSIPSGWVPPRSGRVLPPSAISPHATQACRASGGAW